MSTPLLPPAATKRRPPTMLIGALHVFALSGFAIAQPLYDLLGRYPTFFVAHHAATPADLVVFALVLSAGVPAVLIGIELGAGLISTRLRSALHLAIVGTLTALTVLPPLNLAIAPPTGPALAAAAASGAAAAYAYARVAAVRTLCTLLATAAVAFPALFLFTAPLMRADVGGARPRAAVAEPVPVVVVVFDELSLFALMNEDGAIDAARFPHFAALARQSTWYRNATTVADYTPLALPAILTGRLPDHNRLPTAAEHPDSLFTLLAGTYRLRVAEPVTELCPPDVCPRSAVAPGGATDRAALFTDSLLLWLHMLAPGELRARLPDIGRQWTFQFQRWLFTHLVGPSTGDRPAAFAAFVDGIEPRPEPTLYFAHVLLPHYPYEYLPSGARYNAPPADFHRQRFDLARPVHHLGWAADNPAGAAQEQQRYLLQLALADALLGRLLDRLRDTGLYDEALLVVTADHGVSFRPGESQRYVTETNHPDIMWVPLFVKLPRQREGRVDDRDVQTIDILPTIAAVLGVAIPWHVDGRSAQDASDATAREKVVYTPLSLSNQLELTRLTFPPGPPNDHAALTAQARLFGTGAPASALFNRGPFPALIGNRPGARSRDAPAGFTVRLNEPELYRDVQPQSGRLPAFVRGRLEPRAAIRQPPALAIAVDGVIAATTQAFVADDRSISFGVLLPDPAFRAGPNEVQVFEIRPDVDGEIALHEVRARNGARGTRDD